MRAKLVTWLIISFGIRGSKYLPEFFNDNFFKLYHGISLIKQREDFNSKIQVVFLKIKNRIVHISVFKDTECNREYNINTFPFIVILLFDFSLFFFKDYVA